MFLLVKQSDAVLKSVRQTKKLLQNYVGRAQEYMNAEYKEVSVIHSLLAVTVLPV